MIEPHMQARSLAIAGRSLRSGSLHTEPASFTQPTAVTDIIRAKGSFWTADELAEVLSVSRKHIYKLAKGGRIPCYRMGGTIRFDPEATAQWLEKRAIN
jgi:excisionase family DNA binding protein